MDFSKLTAYVDTLRSVGVPGCDLAVYRDHECLYRHHAGFRDAGDAEPIRGDETYCLYSCSKLFTTCAAMQLIEKGLRRLDAPVSEYLPAYAHLTVMDGDAVRPARQAMTVRHLMSMQSGLDYELDKPSIRAVIEQTGGQATTRQVVDALAKEPLCFDPGEDFLYSLSHDVLGAVIEVASGQRFSDYMRTHIFEPLELRTVGFTLGREARERMCAQYIYDDEQEKAVLCDNDDNKYCFSPNYESGGAGLYCDLKDYITFVDTLACGGVSAKGERILLPETMQLWSANQLGPKSRRTFDEWNRKGYSYALGVRTRVDASVGGRGQIGEFGWDGAAGGWAMIDPVNHVSAYYAMHVRNYGYNYDVIHPTLRDLIYGALED